MYIVNVKNCYKNAYILSYISNPKDYVINFVYSTLNAVYDYILCVDIQIG